MDITIGYRDLFPQIINSNVLSIHKTNATIIYNVTKAGYAFCRVYDVYSPAPESMKTSEVQHWMQH